MNIPIGSPTNQQSAETAITTGSTTVTVSSHDMVQYIILLILLFTLIFVFVFWLLRTELSWRRKVNRDLNALRLSVAEIRATHSTTTV